MLLERKVKNRINLTLSNKVDSFGLQRLLDYAHYLEKTAKVNAQQNDADALAEEINSTWWEANKSRFIKK